MMKKILCCILCCVVFLNTAAWNAFAQIDGVDPTMTGSVLITLRVGDSHPTDGTVRIYQVAYYDEDALDFAVRSAFREISSDPLDFMDPVNLADTTAKAAACAVEKGVKYKEVAIDENGEISVALLPLGIYLITQGEASKGFRPISPLLVMIPSLNPETDELDYQIDATPKVEIETDTPEPPPPETTEPVEVPPDLPHTGQVHWPIPVLALAGIVLVLTGLFIRRRKSRDA